MKLALLTVFLLCITLSFCSVKRISRKAGRTSAPEGVHFQLIYLGNCEQFRNIEDSIHISLDNGACLPINITAGFPDADDLSAHVLCTDIGKNVAQIDFLEIFSVYGQAFNSPFIISFIPNAPFRAVDPGATYYRRPSCTVNKDFCSTTNYVASCTDNAVLLRKGFVVSNDWIYVYTAGRSGAGCSATVDTCCPYVIPGPNQYCPYTAPNGQLPFPQKVYDDYGYGHGKGNSHQNNNQYGNNNAHQNNNNQYGNNNAHQNNQYPASNTQNHGNNNQHQGNNNQGNNNHGSGCTQNGCNNNVIPGNRPANPVYIGANNKKMEMMETSEANEPNDSNDSNDEEDDKKKK